MKIDFFDEEYTEKVYFLISGKTVCDYWNNVKHLNVTHFSTLEVTY